MLLLLLLLCKHSSFTLFQYLFDYKMYTCNKIISIAKLFNFSNNIYKTYAYTLQNVAKIYLQYM